MSQAFRFLGSQRFLGQHYDFDKKGIDDFFQIKANNCLKNIKFMNLKLKTFAIACVELLAEKIQT